MKTLPPRLILGSLAVWNAFRALWMGFFVFFDLPALTRAGHGTPYVSIGIDPQFIMTIAAMPIKLAGVIVGFRFGPAGDTVVELVAAVTYGCLAIGIWHRRASIRRFAFGVSMFELLLLAVCISCAAISPLVPELQPAILYSCSLFFLLYGFVAIWLMRSAAKDLFAAQATSPVSS